MLNAAAVYISTKSIINSGIVCHLVLWIAKYGRGNILVNLANWEVLPMKFAIAVAKPP